VQSRSRIRTALAAVSGVFAVLILVQVFLAGLGVFDDPGSFGTHRNFGYVIGWFTVVMVVLAIAGRTGRRVIGLSALALVQMALQSVFVALRAELPAVAALHPVNGVLLLLVVISVARSAWLSRHEAAATQARVRAGQGVAA